MSSAIYVAPRQALRERAAHQFRLLRVLAGVEFKAKYSDSALGYLWSLLKPLSYFAVLWLVFGHLFVRTEIVPHFALYLIVGVILYTLFVDGVGSALSSTARGGPIIRRLAFPRIVIPVAAILTALITFCVNVSAVVVFVAAARLRPGVDWLLIVPLLLELCAFILGLGLLISILFVRFHDVAQIWDLVAQLLIFASPVMYPVWILPSWAEIAVYANPLVQVMQDIRVVLMGAPHTHDTISSVFWGSAGRLVPIGIAVGTLVAGVWVFRRDAPHLAERV
jgi:ABC-2 type transport system permease protein